MSGHEQVNPPGASKLDEVRRHVAIGVLVEGMGGEKLEHVLRQVQQLLRLQPAPAAY